MSLLPLRRESQTTPSEPRVLGLNDDAADQAFETLTASTTRTVLSIIYNEPSTPTEIRDEIDTSLQNVHYHLGKLEDADLIEPAGIGYSEKGTEMTVYAPAREAVVLFAGRESRKNRVRDFLEGIVGSLAVLAGVSLALGWWAANMSTYSGLGGSSSILIDPVLSFFLGGVLSILVLTGVWYLR